jgi:hypothetical protein
MDVEDYYVQGNRGWLRLQEKGGKQHDMPAHHSRKGRDNRAPGIPRAALDRHCIF